MRKVEWGKGGHVEKGESFVEAVIREMKEESVLQSECMQKKMTIYLFGQDADRSV